MKKLLLGFVALIPFLVSAGDAIVLNSQELLNSILSLKNSGVETSSALKELSKDEKVELLDLVSKEIHNSDQIDLKELENELKKSIHDTI